MTSEPELLLSPSLFLPNETLLLQAGDSRGVPLAALTALYRGSYPDLDIKVRCLHHALELLADVVPEAVLWLYVATEWQQDGPVVRHKGLWRSVEMSGEEVPGGERLPELVIERAGEVRFFSAFAVEPDRVSGAVAFIQTRSCFLVWGTQPTEADLKHLSVHGWNSRFRAQESWADLASEVCRAGNIIVGVFGWFDDLEQGADCIMHRDLFARLLRHHPHLDGQNARTSNPEP